MERRVTDVLVIGGGIAGLSAAITLADKGLKVLVVNRAFDPEDSNTHFAQGGIIWRGEDDSPRLLFGDIDEAGDDAGREKAMSILSNKGPALVQSFLIERLKIPFDRDALGEIDRTKEAAHSRRRIIHVKDQTGAAIQSGLTRESESHPNIEILNGHVLVDLVTNTHHLRLRHEETRVLGAYVLQRKTGKVSLVFAPYTVIATGGVGAIFERTTNPKGARGDGIAVAVRAGARTLDLEYVQFHPTAFAKIGAPSFLISEAVRGEGAFLLNQKNERFMSRYNPELMELAPRDEVARAIFEEMKLQGIPNVWLDFGPIVNKGIDPTERFPGIAEMCRSFGIDIRKDKVPVSPAAHYLCGGILVNEWGRASGISKLYAVGEVSCTGLHGANRLASTSLLEGLVWGKRAAEDITDSFERENLEDWQIPDWKDSEPDGSIDVDIFVIDFMRRLERIMWKCVGLVRSEKGLREAWRELSLMKVEIEEVYWYTKLSDEIIGLRNAVQIAIMITESARRNRLSRGCHFRSDEKRGE